MALPVAFHVFKESKPSEYSMEITLVLTMLVLFAHYSFFNVVQPTCDNTSMFVSSCGLYTVKQCGHNVTYTITINPRTSAKLHLLGFRNIMRIIWNICHHYMASALIMKAL